MSRTTIRHSAFRIPRSRRPAFSLVELLTVIFIISLLIGILIPSLNSARNAAKKLTTTKTINAISAGLEMFKNDNGSDFSQTNGYPPSFSHPPIVGYLTAQEAAEGRFPFVGENTKPRVTGAHWLPAMLIGVDKLGYVKKGAVPNKDSLRTKPYLWYTPDPMGEGKIIDRAPLYMDPGGMPLQMTRKLPGRANQTLFPDWGSGENDPNGVQNLPVITDAFDQPILYYVSNAHGRPTNMVAVERKWQNDYEGSADSQEAGPAYYFHQDNAAFTGTSSAEPDRGWDFGTLGSTGHAIAEPGDTLVADTIVSDEPANRLTFARYILDRKIYTDLAAKKAAGGGALPTNLPLRPVNADTYLLISAGVDGRYGSTDDVSNLPPWPSE